MMELVELPQETNLERREHLLKEIAAIYAAHDEQVARVMVLDEAETAAALDALKALGVEAMIAAMVPEWAREEPSSVQAYLNVYRNDAENRALNFFEENPDENVYREAAIVFRRKAA